MLDGPHKRRGTSRRHMWLVGHYNVSIKKKKNLLICWDNLFYITFGGVGKF